MNKEQIEEALEIIHQPITVNSVEYKYFDIDNFNKLVGIIDYCDYLYDKVKPYVEWQQKQIDQLTNNWNELRHHIKDYLEEWENNDDEWVKGKCDMARDILYDMEEIKENSNE